MASSSTTTSIPAPPSRGDFKSEKAFKQASASYQKTWQPMIDAAAKSAGAQADAAANTAQADQKKRDELAAYQNSTLGERMALAKGPAALIAGGIGGGAEANGLGRLMTGGAKVVSASPGVRALMTLPYLGLGAGALYKSHEFDEQSRDPRNTPLTADAYEMGSNALLGMGGTNLAYGGFNALRDAANPANTAKPDVAKVTAAEAPTVNALAPAAQIEGPKPEPYGGGRPNTEVTNALAKDLGVDVRPGQAKKLTYPAIDAAIKTADEPTLKAIAARVKGLDPSQDAAALRPAIADFARRIGTRGGTLAGLAAILGVGVGGLAGSDTAEAASVTGARPSGDSLNPLPSRGQQITNALGRASSEIASQAPGMAAYAVNAPLAGVRDLANTADEIYTPSRQYTDEAARAQPGRIGREVERAQVGGNIQAAQAEDARQVAEMRARQAAAAPRSFPAPADASTMPQNLQRFAGADPRFEEALRELVAAHGGQM